MAEIKLNAKLQLDIEANQAVIDEMLAKFEKIKKGMTLPADSQTSKDTDALMQKMKKAKAADTTNMDPAALKAHNLEITKIQKEQIQLIQRIEAEETRAFLNSQNISAEKKKQIEDLMKQQKAASVIAKTALNELLEIEKKTKDAFNSAKRAKRIGNTGEDSDMMDSKQLQNAIDQRTVKGTDEAVKGKKGERDALIKHQERLNALQLDSAANIEKAQKRSLELRSEIEKATKESERLGLEKQKVLQTLMDQKKVKGDMTPESEAAFKMLQDELAEQEKITNELRKQLSLESGGNIDQRLTPPEEPKPDKKRGFLQKITAATIYLTVLRQLRKVMNTVISTVRQLDKSITEVAMVTGRTRKETGKLVSEFQNLAMEVGATTQEIAKLSVFFFRQGRSAADALQLTRVAAIAAKVASIDATESANFLTSAINGFGMAADKAMDVSDKFAALGASSASSYQEMAVALSKVAPVAKVAGVGIDFMMGALAKGIEVTREAPENIGTAFKTVFARMTQIRDFGATLDDSVGVNKVEEALGQANVALRDSTGNFRDMDAVLTDLGMVFEDLTRNQQSYIATALAGTRQQSRLLAVMQNFNRTLELVDISSNAAGATLAQHATFSEGLEGATARLTTAFEGLVLSISDSEVIISFMDTLANALRFVSREIERNDKGLKNLAIILAGILVAAIITVTVVTGGLTKAVLSLAGATTLATGGLNILIALAAAAIIAVAGYFIFFREGMSEAEKFAQKAEDISKNVQQIQVDLFNLRKGRNQLENLVKRFQELDRKVVKSAEEVAELDELTAQLAGILKDDYELVVTGKFDDAVTALLETLSKDEQKLLIDEIEGGQKLLDHLSGNAMPFDKSQLENQVADIQAMSKALADGLFGNEFLEASAEEQKNMLEIVTKNFDEFFDNYKKNAVEKRAFDEKEMNIFSILSGKANALERKYNQNVAKPNFFQRAGTFLGSLFGGQTVDDLNREFEEAASEINFDNLESLRTAKVFAVNINGKIAENISLNNLFKNTTEMLQAAAEGQGMTIEEILEKDMNFVIEGLKKHREKLQAEFENQVEAFNETEPIKLNTKIIGMRSDFIDLFKTGTDMSVEDQTNLIQEFFLLDEVSRDALVDSLDQLAFISQIGIHNLATIVGEEIERSGGRLLPLADKLNIIKILSNNGLNITEIERFFAQVGDFTVESILEFLETVSGISDKDFTNLSEDLFDFFSGFKDLSTTFNDLKMIQSEVANIMDLQAKFKEGGIGAFTADEFLMFQERVVGEDIFDDFVAGTLSASELISTRMEQAKSQLDDTIDAMKGKLLSMDLTDAERATMEDQLTMFEHMRDNIENITLSTSLNDFYQSQIDFIKKMNEELQQQIDLEQQKIDMNRSMLSLSRQIIALERDSSFGAQARLEDLKLTRDKAQIEQRKAVMDRMANQRISELENQIQENIQSATTRTALATEAMLGLMGRGRGSRVINATLGINVELTEQPSGLLQNEVP